MTWLALSFYYLGIYLAFIVAPLVPVLQSAILILGRARQSNAIIDKVREEDDASPRRIKWEDIYSVGWRIILVVSLTVFGTFIWPSSLPSGVYGSSVDRILEVGGFIWYELMLVASTWVFTWWWFRLRRIPVRGAFIYAISGWMLFRAVLHTYQSLSENEQNIFFMEMIYPNILIIGVPLIALTVVAYELKKKIPYVNSLMLALALVQVIPQIKVTLLLDAIYIMIIPSIAIVNQLVATKRLTLMVSVKPNFLAFLSFASSVIVVAVVCGAISFAIVDPHTIAEVDVINTVLLHMVVWIAPFIGSALVYIFIKKTANQHYNMEWASLAWLILNYGAALWMTIINIELGGFANLSDAFLGIGFILSVGIASLGVIVLFVSLLLGRGVVIRPLFAASIWLAVLYAMMPLLAHPETPQVLKVLYGVELALTLGAVFFITSRVFGAD